MASDVSLSDGEMEDWEDEEDWTSTDWADPNGNKNLAYPVGHQNINAHTPDLKSRQAADSTSSTAPSNSAESTVVKRMLLNDNKAGMEGLDKDRINQIIHEASKGSKFYENERQKEEQMKRRIEEQRQKIQQISAELMRQGTAEADRLLEDFEQQRDLSRTIVHIDMDAFYAAVEMRDDPSLKNKPMAVGDNYMLSTSNYHARKFGVRAAMPGFIGRKLCPELVIVPTNFEKYTAVSKEVKAIISEYDPNFCPMSLDEAYLDLTEHLEKRQDMSVEERTFICRDSSYADSRAHCKCDLNVIARNYGNQTASMDDSDLNDFFSKSDHFQAVIDKDNDADKCNEKAGRSVVCPKCKKELPPFKCVTFGLSDEDTVNELRTRIEQKTTLTASAGIAPNMMLAKVCSDKNKPNGQYKIQANREDVMDFIKDLPTRKISGIGKVSEAMLNAVGVFTCTDLYEKRGLLYHLYSQISFNYFMRICLGIGSTTVERDSERKSMSTERTFSEMNRPADLYQKCEELCESLSEDLKSEQLKGKTVSIKIKTVKFEVRTRAHTVRDYTNDYGDIVQSARELLKTEIQNCAPQPLRLRLMGVRMSNLLHESLCQRKKQNTIIGAFKRLSKPSAKLETNNEILTVKDVDITDTKNEATCSFQQTGTVEELGTVLDMINDKTKDTVNSDIKNKWKMASDVLDEKGVIELPLAEGKSDEDRVGETDTVDKSVDFTEMPLHEGKSDEDRVDESDTVDKSVDFSEMPLHEEKSDEDRIDKSDAVHKFVDLTENSLQKVEDNYDCEIVSGNEEHLKIKGNENVDRIICDKDINAGEFVCNAKTERAKTVMLENSASQEIEVSIYSPTLRKTRSGFIRTPVSKARRKNRKGGKAKDSAVTYECPVCSLNILCESLQSFNEHVDNCLESGENDKHGGCDEEDLIVIKHESEINHEYGSMSVVKTDTMVETPGDIDISVISSDSLRTVAEESNLKGTFVRVGLASADEKTKCSSTETAREDTEISGKLGSNVALPESEVGTYLTSKDETGTSTNCNLSTEDQDTNETNEASRENSLCREKNSKELAKNTDNIYQHIGIGMDLNRENNGIDKIGDDSEDVDTETESEQGHVLTLVSNEDTVKESELRTQGNSDDVDSEFEENEITSDNLKGCQTEIQEKSTSRNETETIQQLQLDTLEHTTMKVIDSDKKDNLDCQELADEAFISVIPISPKVIIKNVAKTSDDYFTKTGSSFVSKGMTEDWNSNVQAVNLELDLPCSSTQALEKQIEVKGSKLGMRKHHTDLSDDIEEINEDGNSADDDDVDDDRETEGSLLVCPICNTEQRSADLNEFNSHVDSCLSRGAISEILQEQKKQESGALKRSRAAATPQSSKSAKRRKTSMPNISKPCRSIASFFQEK